MKYTIVPFLILSGILFMLIKQWFKNQFMFVAFKEYKLSKKDRLFTWSGWIAVLIFIAWMALFTYIFTNKI